MAFHSILFKSVTGNIEQERVEAPAFFSDLNLDQVIDAITTGMEQYDLKPYFYTSLKDLDSIKYRHEIMQDLENKTVLEKIKAFARKLGTMRQHLEQSEKLYYTFQKERWFLDAVEIYCDAVKDLVHDLSYMDIKSRGLLAFREYITNYAESDRFRSLLAETKQLKSDLSTIRYCLLINGKQVTVRKYEAEIDYSTEVEETFAKFKQSAVNDYSVDFPFWPEMNHVEAQILDLVAQLYPEIFSRLDAYYAEHIGYLDETIAVFDREIHFYIAYLDYLTVFKRAGLPFCYPQFSDQSKEICNYQGFDLALAYKLINENSPVVCNDFHLEGKERILVVTGPNQGGKTTFARAFGQLHYLASIGCPVPGKRAHLFLFDRLFTHFEKEENIQNLRGKLQDDLVRIHAILNQATSNSIIIMNEIFTSTTSQDAIFLGKKVMEKIIELDLLAICVTFIDELAFLSEKIVSVVSTVVPENPTLRTYKIVRRPADGLAYALSIAEKHRLTYQCLKERIKV